MNRRDLFRLSTAMGLTAALPGLSSAARQREQATYAPLQPPAEGSIPVAFLLSDGAVMIDFAGPWEVFQNVSIPGRDEPFKLYTVAATTNPIKASGGMTIVPDYSFANAPEPKVIVIPAQSAHDDAVLAWVRQASQHADLTMSVCTGAFLLAKLGLLDGRSATSHWEDIPDLRAAFPAVNVVENVPYVDEGRIVTSAGISAGIGMSLHLVARILGHPAAEATARQMQYDWSEARPSAA